MNSEIKTLIGKLNPTCHQGLEEAAGLCVSQTNFNVEIEHYLLKLLQYQDTDLHRLLRYYEIPVEQVERELTQSIDRLKRGNDRTPVLSQHIPNLLQEAWVASSLAIGGDKVRTGGLLYALLDKEYLRGIIFDSSKTLQRIPRDSLREDLKEIIRGSREDNEDDGSAPAPMESAPEEEASPKPKDGKGRRKKTPSLDQYTIDLCAEARAGKIDPITGRDFEIRQVVDILTRRRQNNPILTGEAGVGKTAVVEGFALRIVEGDVPPPLQNVSVRTLDLGLLQAGAGVRGEFENRLKSVIKEVKESPHPIILFIDEAHTMIGAGAGAGQNDAANLLKPPLARGELRTIGATTWSEYKKYFEKDPALTRRFQVVKVNEPDEETAVEMLRGTVAHLEKHHNVRILDEAVHSAVHLSHRFITGRQLPDKAVSVLDTASARVALAQSGSPPALENAVRRIEQLELECQVLTREQSTGQQHHDRLKVLRRELKKAQKEKEVLEKRWKKELALAEKIGAMKTDLEDKQESGKKIPKSQATRLQREQKKLSRLQGEEPMISVCVDSNSIAAVISGWTGIPAGKMLADEIRLTLSLKEKLAERVVGQDHALETICQRIQTSKAEMEDPGKPVGVFLLVGPSGVGKTETAHALADALYGGDKNLVRINMSEYQEAHTVSGLKGSPPGYVGFGQGGVLTEAVRRSPYCTVLLDEVEKAHPDVMEIFYQVFDKGLMEDAEGLEIDFKNTVILLTSNLGTQEVMELCNNPKKRPNFKALTDKIRPVLVKHFPPAFLGRLVIAPYYPLGKSEILKIVHLKLDKIKHRFKQNHKAGLTFDKELAANLAAQCAEVDSGARNIDNILTQNLLPELSREVLQHMAEGKEFANIRVSQDRAGKLKYHFRY